MTDVTFVQGTPFFITMSHSKKFVIVKHVPTCMDIQFSKSLKIFMKIYSRSIMVVHNVLMDKDLDKTIYDMVVNVVVNTSVSK